MSAKGLDDEGLDEAFLAAVKAHVLSEKVRARAQAAGLDLESLRLNDPLTYAAANAVLLVRTDARLAPQVSAVLARLGAQFQPFSVPLRVLQTDTELRVFPALSSQELVAFDDALAALATAQPGGVFYRTVSDTDGERRELAWPLEPGRWHAGPALVGPFVTEEAAKAWGREHAGSGTGLVFDTLLYDGAWFCDVFSGE